MADQDNLSGRTLGDHAVAVGPASDLYALAVVAFEALTGRRPFEGETTADHAQLHRFGEIPALGGHFPPALDRMLQRALAKRPQDRWGTALELAGALRVASGLGTSSADLPRIDAGVRDAWLAGAPQPLAESVAALDSARNAHQAHIATQELARNLLRYLLTLALVTHEQVREGQDDPALLELARVLDRRELSTEERIQLVRLLVRPQSIEFDPTSKLVVVAGDKSTVIVSETLGMPVAVFDLPRGVARTAHFDPTSRRIVAANWDGTAQVWDATSPYRRWSSSPVATDCGLATSLEPDRRLIAIGCRNRNTRVWDTARDQLIAELPSVTPVAGDFTSAFPAVSAAGDRAAIARGNTVEVYELPGSRLIRVIMHGAAVNAVAFAPVGHDLINGAIDGSLLVTRDDRDPSALPASDGGIDAVGFLVDGRAVASDARGQLRVYDSDRAAVVADLELPTRVRLLRPSPDGLRLVTIPSFTSKAVPPLLWDLKGYRLITQLKNQVGQAFSARYVDGEHAILTVGADGAARLWSGETGRLLSAYRSTSRYLVDAVVASDGSMVIAGGSDGLVWFWDRATARPLWTLQAHSSDIVGIHLEGDEMVTRGFAGDVSRWALPKPEQVIQALRSTADRQEGDACAIVPAMKRSPPELKLRRETLRGPREPGSHTSGRR